jgi:hypothetical protein
MIQEPGDFSMGGLYELNGKPGRLRVTLQNRLECIGFIFTADQKQNLGRMVEYGQSQGKTVGLKSFNPVGYHQSFGLHKS